MREEQERVKGFGGKELLGAPTSTQPQRDIELSLASGRTRELEAELALLRKEMERMQRDFQLLQRDTRAQLATLERVISQQLDSSELARLKDLVTRFKRDVEQSVTYLSEVMRLYHQAINDLRMRMDRYANLGPVRYIRTLRRRIFRL